MSVLSPPIRASVDQKVEVCPQDQSRGRRGRDEASPDPGQRGNKWWTLVAVVLGTFMLLLDITIVNVALPDIQQRAALELPDLQWIVDAYALTLAAFLLTAGSLADMYGRRLLYLSAWRLHRRVGAVRLRRSTLMLQLSRALQGIGGAIMFAVSLALLATLSAARTAASRSASGAPSPGWPSPSGRCSAGC